MNKRKVGFEGESKAVEYLKEKGYTVLQTNFYSRYGEIDLIAKDKETIVFIEVKYRKNNQYGMGMESISSKKVKSLSKTAKFYLKSEDIDCRFDVISIDNNIVSHIINAFEYEA
ncbi:MAG: YraN family protein [Candidatus Sericytochromatia bacterium]